MGIRLIIIELRKYNEIGELLIENGTAGSQAQVSYWDVVWEASVTRVAVCMGVEEMGMQTGHRGTYTQPLSWDQEQVCVWALQSNQKSISTPQDRNRLEEKKVGALRSQVFWLSSLPMRWHMVAQLSHDAHVILGCSHVTQGHGGAFQLGF